MRKNTPVILLLVFTIFAASVLCCCATEVVEAQSELPACHQKAHDQNERPDQECECTQIQSLAAAPSLGIIKPAIAQFDTIDIFSSLNSSVTQQSDLYLLLALSLERTDSPPPLYLKHSNLRL